MWKEQIPLACSQTFPFFLFYLLFIRKWNLNWCTNWGRKLLDKSSRNWNWWILCCYIIGYINLQCLVFEQYIGKYAFCQLSCCCHKMAVSQYLMLDWEAFSHWFTTILSLRWFVFSSLWTGNVGGTDFAPCCYRRSVLRDMAPHPSHCAVSEWIYWILVTLQRLHSCLLCTLHYRWGNFYTFCWEKLTQVKSHLPRTCMGNEITTEQLLDSKFTLFTCTLP